ncbi:MAG: putative lipid II flippase FtsW [Pseudomonadota bacterium]|nr:putative lipid II flippase FtsW [Pseudomonadota bacterium]
MKRRYDHSLLFLTLTLVSFGLAMVYSASAFIAAEQNHNAMHHVTRQGFAALLGFVFMAVLARLPYKELRAWAPTLYFVTTVSLLLVWVPGIGHSANGSARWFGLAGIHFQPAEFLKVVLLVCVATWLHRNRTDIHNPRRLAGLAGLMAVPLGLVALQPDFGSTAIITVLAGLMFFFAGLRWAWIAVGSSAMVGGLGLLMVAEPYRIKRLMSFMDPFADCGGDGYQVCQSLLALHHGGLFGQGPGESSAKLLYLPEPYNDFIAAVLGEELGLVGVVALLLLYGFFAARGFSIARRAADPFGALLASTFTAMIVAQACLNLGVVTSLVPPKGLVLPFISYGASAMMVNLAAVGVLLSVSAEARQADAVPAPKGAPETTPRLGAHPSPLSARGA